METKETFDTILQRLAVESRQMLSCCSVKSETVFCKALRMKNAIAYVVAHRKNGGKIRCKEVEEQIAGARMDCEALAKHGIRDRLLYSTIIFMGKRYLGWEELDGPFALPECLPAYR